MPPALAARLRAGVPALLRELLLRDDDPLAEVLRADAPLPEALRAEDPPLRDVLRDEELRADVLRDEELRAEPPERDDDLREEDDPPLDDLRDDPPLRPPPDFRLESAMSRSSSAPRYEAGLCHLEARFDGRVIGQAHPRAVAPHHLASLGR